jgi:type VI secretion system protein VasG
VESGARNVDHILRGSILPLVSQRVLGALAEGGAARALKLSVGTDGNFQCTETS